LCVELGRKRLYCKPRSQRSGLLSCQRQVSVGDLIHDDEAAPHGTEQAQEPGQVRDVRDGEVRVERQHHRETSQREAEHAERRVIDLQLDQLPVVLLRRLRVEQEDAAAGLHDAVDERDQAKRAVPGLEVLLAVLDFIGHDDDEADRGANHGARL